ncbi:hypothetical protein [Candidatus Thiosymbion oneisti]|uniref:hypothetical protein n=1 Tax=Candidatus Thiosymbion oneisti TaxID=589554 RepID=UPI00105C8B72|nr:hypothetical protein [Candidatus Thiosymbion oneisti]
MRPQLVFNDLSVREAQSRATAAQWLSDMVQTIADLIDEGMCGTTIHTNRPLYELDLIPDEYGFQEWVFEGPHDDLRILAAGLIDQSPVAKGLFESSAETGEFERSDFRIDEAISCEALGVALTWDGIAVSLPSEERWRATEIPISSVSARHGSHSV